MKFLQVFLSLAIFCFAAVLAAPIPSYIVFYPHDQAAIMADAKQVIIKAGGKILYEYKNFGNSFAATIPDSVIEQVRKMGNPQINKDRVMCLDSVNSQCGRNRPGGGNRPSGGIRPDVERN